MEELKERMKNDERREDPVVNTKRPRSDLVN
jgi:hypothetical protein